MNMIDLDQRVAIVTGGAQGIGLAVAAPVLLADVLPDGDFAVAAAIAGEVSPFDAGLVVATLFAMVDAPIS